MIKAVLDDLAIFGGCPVFEPGLAPATRELPPWDEFAASFSGIFERRHFTNHGPLVRQLDARMASVAGTRHAVCVINAEVALMVAVKALDLTGDIVVPALAPDWIFDALRWAGLTPVPCDVDPCTLTVAADAAEACLTEATSAILGLHLWGNPCDLQDLRALCRRRGLPLIVDLSQVIGGGSRVAGGDVNLVACHRDGLLSAGEGGCLATDDDALADCIRTVRNFHVSESFVQVPLRINGKMTEAQAALMLGALANLDHAVATRRRYCDAWRMRASTWTGLVDRGSQFCVLEVDAVAAGLSRDLLLRLFHAENIGAHPPFGVGPTGAFPIADRRRRALIQLPIGAATLPSQADAMIALVEFCLTHAGAIVHRLANEAMA